MTRPLTPAEKLAAAKAYLAKRAAKDWLKSDEQARGHRVLALLLAAEVVKEWK